MRSCLFKALDKRSILRLAQTSKQVRDMIYGDRALWNINRQLTLFFQDPVVFRSQLALCDGLIAGSFALQFFEQVSWPGSDIDLYANMGENMESMDSYLIKEERYIRAPPTRLEESEYGGYETTNPHCDVIEVSFLRNRDNFIKVSALYSQVQSPHLLQGLRGQAAQGPAYGHSWFAVSSRLAQLLHVVHLQLYYMEQGLFYVSENDFCRP